MSRATPRWRAFPGRRELGRSGPRRLLPGHVVLVAVCLCAFCGVAPARTVAAPPLPELLSRLTLCSHPQLLSGLHMSAVETWLNRQGAGYAPQHSEVDRVFFYRGVEVEQALSRNGRVIPAQVRTRQQRWFQHLKVRVDHHWTGPEDAGRMINIAGEIWTLPQIERLYHWQEAPGPVIDGIATVRLSFTPNGAIHPGSRVQNVMLSVKGFLNVDPATGQILSGSFDSTGPVRFGMGLLAKFNRLKGWFQMQHAGPAWVYHRIEVYVDGRELWHRMHGAEIMTYRVDPLQKPLAPAPQIALEQRHRREKR